MKRLLLCLFFIGCATAQPATSPSASVSRSRADFPLLEHDRVAYHIDRFTGEKRDEFAASLGRMAQYESMIREKLRRRGMPEELLYLAFIESGFNTAAHSTQEARGIWQLVPATAQRWGLTVNETTDERLDAEKATDAALSYLAYLYNRFGSWYLAAAAYNAGENKIARIMTEATGKESGTDEDYFRIWDQLPAETRDFLPVMIATIQIARDPARYRF